MNEILYPRSQLQEACQLLEAERRQHRELRRASQKTSDQVQLIIFLMNFFRLSLNNTIIGIYECKRR